MRDTAVALKKIAVLETLKGHKLAVTWDDAPKAVIDFTSMIQSRGDLRRLKDDSEFRKARIGERRRSIEWPDAVDELGMIDIDAETLFDISRQQSNAAFLHRIVDFITSQQSNLLHRFHDFLQRHKAQGDRT